MAQVINIETGYGVIKDANGKIVRKVQFPKGEKMDLEDGYTFEAVADFSALEAVQMKVFNSDRFMASLLNDKDFVSMMYEDFFPALGFCLQNKNFTAVNAVMSKCVSDGKVDSKTVDAFKAKLLAEEGVDLNA